MKITFVADGLEFEHSLDKIMTENSAFREGWLKASGFRLNERIDLRNLEIQKLIVLLSGIPVKERKSLFEMWCGFLFPITGIENSFKIRGLYTYLKLIEGKVGFALYNGETYPLKRFMSHYEVITELTPKITFNGWTVQFIEDHQLLSEEERKLIEDSIDFNTSIRDAFFKMGQQIGLSPDEMDQAVKEAASALRGEKG